MSTSETCPLTMVGAVAWSNERTLAEHRIPCKGLVINAGGGDFTILELSRISERVMGDTYAAWKVLVERDASNRDPFVIWTLIARPEGWSLESGTYCKTEEVARSNWKF